MCESWVKWRHLRTFALISPISAYNVISVVPELKGLWNPRYFRCPGSAIGVKTRQTPLRTTFYWKVGEMTNFSLKSGPEGCFLLQMVLLGPRRASPTICIVKPMVSGGVFPGAQPGKWWKSPEIRILMEILWFSLHFAKFHRKSEFPIKTDYSVPRRARPRRQQRNQWFRVGILRVQNPEILEFSGNHGNPDFHGNSVNSSENTKYQKIPLFTRFPRHKEPMKSIGNR